MDKVLKVTLEIQDLDPEYKLGDRFAASVCIPRKRSGKYFRADTIEFGAMLEALTNSMVPEETDNLIVLFEKVTPPEK